MRKIYLILLSLALLSAPLYADIASALIKLTNGFAGGQAGAGSVFPSVSPNGKLIAFQSFAVNLVKNDTNGASDIFVAIPNSDKKLFRVNLGRKKSQSNGPSTNPSVSAKTPNGKYLVTYESDATDLGRRPKFPDDNGFQDIYATVFPKIFTFRISKSFDGGLTSGRSEDPDVALVPEPDRVFITYSSNATNIVADDTNSFKDIYLAKVTIPSDLQDKTDLEKSVRSSRISIAANGLETDGDSSSPQISGDGNFIVFESEATNLIAGQSISAKQIYLYDIKKNTTELISKSSDGSAGNANSRNANINYNGRYIVYLSTAKNIVEGSANGNILQVFRYDRQLGITERVNVTAEGVLGNGSAAGNAAALLSAQIDASGRFVLFIDRASNLVANDENGANDVFLKDMASGKLEKISKAFDGSGTNGASLTPAINREDFTSLKGLVAFVSNASNIVTDDTNEATDLFMANLTFDPLPLSSERTLDVPAAVSVSGENAKLSLELFSSPVASPLRRKLSRLPAKAPTVRYSITYTKEASSGRRKEVTKLLTKKNSISLKNLKPGTYSLNYRAQVVQGSKVISQTNKSPAQRFSIS